MTRFYELGKQFANTPPDAAEWLDVADMSYEQRLEFNRGFDDGTNEQRIVKRLMIALSVVSVAACVFFWWVGA